jgi:hypothetical protein
MPPKVTVVPKISALAPSPESVAVHELVVQETFSEEQPASGARASAPASSPAARRGRRVVERVDMPRA